MTEENLPFWQKGLNTEQQKAVEQTEGPALILAGAGSGKTKTLTHRIAYLLAVKKVRPENILAVTFTNKAAGEMRERVRQLLHSAGMATGERVLIGTFHSVCVRILRKEIQTLGVYSGSFNIYDSDDQQAFIRQALRTLEISVEQVRPRAVADAISKAKNNLKTPEQFTREAAGYYEEIVSKVYALYQQELVRANALDFDDIIMQTVTLFQKNDEVRQHYQELFQYVLVDEYQDTNHSQYLLVTLLAQRHHNLFVIGDDYQSIYGWREADIRNILDFEKDYPDAQVITLNQNYRSTQTILDAAQGVISNNTEQRKKELWTSLGIGEKITQVVASDETAEARFVATEAQKHFFENPKKTLAVLYRTNAQSRALEEMFLRLEVAYKIVGGIKFYHRKEVKDMVGLVRFYTNPQDTLALERILGSLKTGIGKATFERWAEACRQSGGSYETVLDDEELLVSLGLTIRKIKALQQFVDIFKALRAEVATRRDMNVALFLERLSVVTLYQKVLLDGTPEGEDRLQNVRELFSVATKFTEESLERGLALFLDEVALASDTDEIEQKGNQVEMMTIHSAKGLEFDVVFVIGLEEGIFPHSRSAVSISELEEERRLMYVALTRAKHKAYVICTEERVIFGNVQYNPPSRFLEEIPEHLREEKRIISQDLLGRRGNRNQARPQLSRPLMIKKTAETKMEKTALATAGDLRPGDMVRHQDFGSGLVMTLAGSLVTVAFKDKGVKTMMLGIAPLEKI
jgi:DNA helicase-2/ATP-dependent DNA helicase PcrA